MEQKKLFILMLVISIVIGFIMVKFTQFKYDDLVEGLSKVELEEFSEKLSNHRLSLLANLVIAFLFLVLMVLANLFKFPNRTKGHIVSVMGFIGGFTAVIWMVQFTRLLGVIL